MNSSYKKSLLLLTGATIILTLGAELIVSLAGTLRRQPTLMIQKLELAPSAADLKVDYQLTPGSARIKAQVSFFAVSSDFGSQQIYYFQDASYHLASVTKSNVNGVYRHLMTELQIRHHRQTPRQVDAQKLAQLMLDYEAAPKSIVIIATGAFPSTVFSKERNLVRPWIEHGGTLIWIADVFAYYIAEPGKPLHYFDTANPRENGMRLFFDNNVQAYQNARTERVTSDTPISRALALNYSYIWKGISLSEMQRIGGLALGKADTSLTSIASLPLGRGYVIIWGGILSSVEDEDMVGRDLSQIIVSEAWRSRLLGLGEYTLEDKAISDTAKLPWSKEWSHLLVYAYQKHDRGNYFERKVLSVGR